MTVQCKERQVFVHHVHMEQRDLRIERSRACSEPFAVWYRPYVCWVFRKDGQRV